MPLMSGPPRTIRVFIASPGDLAVERRTFKDTIDELNKGFGRGADVEFIPLGWEDALSEVGRRPQSVINADVDSCDVFVLVMWRRWGQKAPDANPLTSYTEEEFYRALTRFERDGAPTLFVFFKHIDPGQMADAGPQLQKVLDFRRKLEKSRKVIYREFKIDGEFKIEIDRHLCAFAKGETQSPDKDRRVPLLPDSVLEEIEKAKSEVRKALERAEKAERQAKDAQARADAAERVAEAKAAKAQLALAERAAKAALEGKIEEARQDFAKALDGTTELQALFRGFEFFKRIGELDEAERLLRRWLALSGPNAQTVDTAAAYGNLGNVLETRGDLDGAEAMYRKSLAIEEKLGRLEGMAKQYGNLGVVLATRGDLGGAEAMCRRSLEINEKLGRLEGMAKQYGNLGNVLKTRGDLDGAEAMYRTALEINEKLGRLEGMAIHYGNLGTLLEQRGHQEIAREHWIKARDLYERLGAKHRVEQVQGWLDGLDP